MAIFESFSFKKSFKVMSYPLNYALALLSPYGAISKALIDPSLDTDLLPVLELLSLALEEMLLSFLRWIELVVMTIYGPYGAL